ncbi:MAG TPA: hypothetical protein VF581_03535 [Flavobacterium sp.]|jgi:hypothetical protein
MYLPKQFLSAILLLTTVATFSQTESANKSRISTAITNYFKPDRENIHLHMNKNQYLSTEDIWFKGYIIEKKTGSPYGTTSNVFVQLLDEQGKYLNSKLYYAENSTFDGHFPLEDNYKTGVYYLQVYTNYMNNFTEDESSVYKIAVINPNEGQVVNTTKPKLDTAEMTFYPESGVFLQGTSNTIGVRLADCNQIGISVPKGEVHDSKGNVVTTFSTNQFGYGKFDLLSTAAEQYKVVYELNDKKVEKLLALPSLKGITFSANNYALANKAVIKIKTNSNTISEIADQPYTLVIQKADAVTAIDFSFKSNVLEQTVVIPSEELLDGLTTIYVVDKNLRKIAERSIFKPRSALAKTTLQLAGKSLDSLKISGISPLKFATLSVSVLPEEALSESSANSIYSSLLFDNYLSTPIVNAGYFLNDFNRKKHFELDNMLLTKTTKYNWDAMLASPPDATKFQFDSGLTIKGTVNTELDNPTANRVHMTSILLGIDETVLLNEKKEFYFDNLMAVDSTNLHFELLDAKSKASQLKMYPQIVGNNRKLVKSFKVMPSGCGLGSQVEATSLHFPVKGDGIELEEVAIEGRAVKKDTLTFDRRWGNNMANGYKIGENEKRSHRDVLNFIAAHGYDVLISGGNVQIVGRAVRSLSGSSSPAVYMDDMPLNDLTQLLNYPMDNVDEIYINKRSFGGGASTPNGIIRIYNKKFLSSSSAIKIRSQAFVVTNGFQDFKSYENVKYQNYNGAEFKNFGVIGWLPMIETTDTGAFRFSVPNLAQKNIRLQIEGIASNGDLISETITVNVE